MKPIFCRLILVSISLATAPKCYLPLSPKADAQFTGAKWGVRGATPCIKNDQNIERALENAEKQNQETDEQALEKQQPNIEESTALGNGRKKEQVTLQNNKYVLETLLVLFTAALFVSTLALWFSTRKQAVMTQKALILNILIFLRDSLAGKETVLAEYIKTDLIQLAKLAFPDEAKAISAALSNISSPARYVAAVVEEVKKGKLTAVEALASIDGIAKIPSLAPETVEMLRKARQEILSYVGEST